MSGGQLVVLDRLGRDVKRYPLPEGLATLGSDPACDIRIMLPTVSPHHATVVVHANQTVVRNVSTGETLVNGVAVSVAALRHRDTLEIGGRALRWEYSDHHAHRPLAPQPALYQRGRAPRSGSPRRGRRSAVPPPAPRSPGVRLALELQHRASMPASGKQVAIVQPQRRHTADRDETSTPPRPNSSAKRSRSSNNDLDSSASSEAETSKRKSNAARPSPRNTSLQSTTKASLWIESRKSSPRKSSRPHAALSLPVSPRRGQPARRGTPLRLAVLRKAQSASKPRVTKIEAPLTVDHTKQAAILLMTRHTPKKSISPSQPSFVVKKRSPRAAPAPSSPAATPPPRAGSRASKNSTLVGTPVPGRPTSRSSSRLSNSTLLGSPALSGSPLPRSSVRASASVSNTGSPSFVARSSRGRTLNGTNDVLLVELSDSTTSQWSGTSRSTPQLSPLLPSPKKSALKDPASKRSSRKTESIKFDLSNLENFEDQSQDVFFVSDVTRKDADESQTDADLTLHYESSIKSPSPRKSIHSRSSKILEKTLGTTISEPQSSVRETPPVSPRPRKSSRVSTIVQNALETSGNSRYSQRTTKSVSDESYDTTVASAFKTRTLSPRSPSQKNMESYSIVDLVSVDSNQSGSSSVYNSMRSTKSTDTFGTPQNSTGRKTRSTIDPTLLTSSTPYVAKTRSSQRSSSSPNVSRSSRNTSQVSRGSSRRSKSLSTPENTQKHISVNSTRVSRGPRSRSRINDSDLLLISALTDDESPKTSRRQSRAEKSILGLKSPVISPKRLSRGSKSMLSPKSPLDSPKRLSRGSKSILSPKSPVLSPKNLSAASKSILSPKSPVTNLKRLSRGSKSTLSPKSPVTSPKQVNRVSKSKVSLTSPSPKRPSRGSKSVQSSESPITSPRNQSRLSKSASTSQSPTISPKRQSRASKSILSPTSPLTNPQRQSRSSKSISGSKSPVSSPNKRSFVSKSSTKSPVIGSKRTSRSSKSTLSPISPAPSPKRASRATKSIASPSSPAKSPKSSSKSPKSSSKANVSKKTRGTFTVSSPSGSPSKEGVSTPENRHSPVAVGTPVLSIQSLLDSSQSSLVSQRSTKRGRGYSQRKTIGGIPPKPKNTRASFKSKSFNFGARKTASRLSKDSGASDRTVEGTAQEEDIVTPKSAVKLIQEAVKNKHSTAKKPQSKRSIIDDLNESDIGKHLFNSPVKRKLSQSMTEFSRKQLFDDDEVAVKRPTRNTVALGRTPDNSILLNQSESYTPEVFVSPLGTPNNSINLTGIKRLFKKQTPENDLRNVRGVKGLLKTPRTRRSIKNDLTRVSGVKSVFARSPKNRLSDVRVKDVFAVSPNNDLRRVSGVKTLFQSQKRGRKSPNNDLRDVRGVKKLFSASSPANDLRDVAGVRTTLRRNSPRNDLTDVRGVKGMFGREKPRGHMDVSGVEELFNESREQGAEAAFDRLPARPPPRAAYSRSYSQPHSARTARRGVALHASIDEIIAKPDEWIARELEKCFEKKTANASSRELLKLATDTLAGAAPLRVSRGRSGALPPAPAPRPRSTADNYSAHTLPIKKRSLVDLSQEARSPGAAPGSRALPIKKRALVHSTPVKGRAANALPAELGRVSPIELADTSARFTTTVVDIPALQTTRHSTKAKPATPQAKIASPKATAASPKGKVASPKAKTASPIAKVATPQAVVISPKKTRDKVTITVSPRNTRKTNVIITASPKATRKSKNVSATKKATLVVTKKAPIMSPKPTRATKTPTSPSKTKSPAQTASKSPSPQKRGTRKQKTATELVTEEKPKSPKRTRGKRVSLVVSKPSPKMKPRAAKQTEDKPQDAPETTRRTRKTTAPTEDKKTESPKATARATRNQKAEVVAKHNTKTAKAKGKAQKEPKTNKDKSVEEKPNSKTRGNKAEVSVDNKREPARATRGKKSGPQKVESPKKGRKAAEVEKPAQKRGRKTEAVEPTPEPPKRGGRGRKTVEIEKPVSPKKGKKAEVAKPVARRGRNTEPAEEKAESPKKGRRAESKAEKSATQRRGKNIEVEEKVVSPKRGRKTEAKVEAKPAAQTRGRKTEVAQKETKVSQTRGKRDASEAQGSKSSASVSPRGKRGKASEPAEKTTRGRKAEPEVTKPVRGASKADTNRKRKSSAADELPAKLRKTGKQAAPATRKRKTAADTPTKPAKDTTKRAKRVVVKPATPKAAPKAAKRSTRGKR